MTELHIITSEYPPQVGGVGDYTRVVAEGLAAAGESVHVWCPRAGGEEDAGGRVTVHREFGDFSPGELRRVGRLLDAFPRPRRVLVQYVPHGYGYRSMNLAFCLWLWGRAARGGDRVEVMVHEPCLAFGEGSWRQTGAAVVHRLMAAALMRAASRVWVSIPAWENYWRPYAFGRRAPFEWLPVPSTVPAGADEERAAAVRARLGLAPDQLLAGHFGTYSPLIAGDLRRAADVLLAEGAGAHLLLLGRGGDEWLAETLRARPRLAGRVHAAGYLSPPELSAHLAACDLVVQPFPDGVSTRRTSVMAALACGRPVVTTRGRLTEEFWGASGAVALAEAGDPDALGRAAARLLSDPSARARLGRAGRALYRARFAVEHTIAALRREPEPRGAAPAYCPPAEDY